MLSNWISQLGSWETNKLQPTSIWTFYNAVYYKKTHVGPLVLSGEFSKIGLGMVMVKVLIARLTPYIPLLLEAEN